MVLRVTAIRTEFLLVFEGGCPGGLNDVTTAVDEGIENWQSA